MVASDKGFVSVDGTELIILGIKSGALGNGSSRYIEGEGLDMELYLLDIYFLTIIQYRFE